MTAFQNTTLATLQARLAERYEGQAFWTADQARRAINEGLRIWNVITGTWRARSAGLLTIPNDPYLFVGGAVEKVTQVKIGTRVLNPVSIDQLDQLVGNWEGTTAPAATSCRFWAPVGITEIALFPADAAPAQQAVSVDGIVAAPILVNVGDFLDLGDEEINTLLGYALHVLSFAKGAAAIASTRPLYIAFIKAAAARNAVFAASSLYRKLIGIDFMRYALPMRSEPAAATGEALVASQAGEGGGS